MNAAIQKSQPEVDDLDFSCRLPLLVLFISAAIWVVIASAFGLVSSLKFHSPAILANNAWLTYGRVWPAFQNSLLYGFCIQAGLGVGLWILVQLGRVVLVQPLLVVLGATFWNLGVTVGVLGILAGDSTGFENLEMPGYAGPFVFLGYLLIGLFAVLTFHERRERLLSSPQWFLFTAIFWFLWVYSTAELLLVTFSVRGVTQAVITWWFSQNVEVVWLGLVGLATAFYFWPKFAERELDHYLALFTYWMFILFASWGGIPVSAPLPAWIPSLSTVATVMTLIPLLAVGLIVRRLSSRKNMVTTRSAPSSSAGVSQSFIRFGVLSFVCAGLMRILDSLPEVSPVTHLTWFTAAIHHLQTYGFFSMVLFGALYSIIPQLSGTSFPSSKLIRAHLWMASLGVLFAVAPLAVGGIAQGFRLQDPSIAFLDISKSTLMFLRVSTLGDLLILLGNSLFLVNLLGLVKDYYKVRAEAAYAAVTADLFKHAEAKS